MCPPICADFSPILCCAVPFLPRFRRFLRRMRPFSAPPRRACRAPSGFARLHRLRRARLRPLARPLAVQCASCIFAQFQAPASCIFVQALPARPRLPAGQRRHGPPAVRARMTARRLMPARPRPLDRAPVMARSRADHVDRLAVGMLTARRLYMGPAPALCPAVRRLACPPARLRVRALSG